MGLQISNHTKQKAKDVAIYGGTGLALLTSLLSISAAIANCVAPESIKPLVDLFKGEKNFTLAVSLFALISSALAVLGMAYLIYRHKSQILESTFKKEKDNYESQREVLELTVKKEGNDLIVNGEDLNKLNFDINNKAIIMTDHRDNIVIEKTDDTYKVIENQSTYNFPDLKDNEEIKLKIYQPIQSLQNTQIINAITCPTQIK
ncbi:MAG: hypothetical protein U0X86_000292 [Wolbachia endosymbiont of Xenopsylla cheopis]